MICNLFKSVVSRILDTHFIRSCTLSLKRECLNLPGYKSLNRNIIDRILKRGVQDLNLGPGVPNAR